jgi:hypothetical protein
LLLSIKSPAICRAFLCTGSTVFSNATDGKELLCTGSTVFSNATDGKELLCTGSTVFSSATDGKELLCTGSTVFSSAGKLFNALYVSWVKIYSLTCLYLSALNNKHVLHQYAILGASL